MTLKSTHSYSIAVINGKGGSSKSTTSRALTIDCLQQGKDAALVSMDIKQKSQNKWHEYRDAYGHQPDVEILTIASVAQLRLLIKSARYQNLIIDTGGYESELTPEIAHAVDFVVMPCSTSLEDMTETNRAANGLVIAGIPKDKIMIALAKTAKSARLLREAYEFFESLDYYVSPHSIRFMDGYQDTTKRGLALNETTYSTLLPEATAFCAGIRDRFNWYITEGQNNG